MRAAKIASFAFLVACAVYAGSNLRFVYLYWWPEPFSDQRHWIDAIYRSGPWAAFTLSVNEHRPLVHSALFLLDWYAFNGSQVFLEWLVLLTQFGAFALLLQPLLRHAALPRPAVWMIAGLTLVWATWLLQCENLCWPLELSLTLASFCNVAACRWASRLWSRPEPATWRACALAALPPAALATIGTFAFAHGLAAWPALAIFSAMVRRFKLAAVMGMAGVAVVAAYVAAGVRTSPSFDVLEVANFALVFLGRPFAPAWLFEGLFGRLPGLVNFSTYPWLWIASLLGLLLFCAFLAAYLRRPRPVAGEAFLLAVAAIAVGAALLTAIGRARYGPDGAFVSRYVSAQLLFWYPLVALGTLHLFRLCTQAWIRALWGVGIAALVLWTLPSNREMGSFCREHFANLRQQTLAVRMGILDEYGWRFMVADPPGWMPMLARLQRDGKTIFGGRDISPVGTSFPDNVPETPCEGAITKTRSVQSSRVITGWTWFPRARSEASEILLVRLEDRRIIGAGYPGALYAMSTGAQSEPEKWNAGWTAHTLPAPGPEPFQVWARAPSGYCRVGPVRQ